MKNSLDKTAIDAFWTEKSKEPTNRWSGNDMLEFEKDLLSKFAANAKTIIDLGSGHGELSRSILPIDAKLIAVDYIDNYKNSFTQNNQEFICSSVLNFSTLIKADLSFLFGVITYLSLDEEVMVYEKLASFTSHEGWIVIKNQCSYDLEIIHNGFSDDLGCEYSSRYPAYTEQINRLNNQFEVVNPVLYPNHFNKWANTFHVAFFCQKKKDSK